MNGSSRPLCSACEDRPWCRSSWSQYSNLFLTCYLVHCCVFVLHDVLETTLRQVLDVSLQIFLSVLLFPLIDVSQALLAVFLVRWLTCHQSTPHWWKSEFNGRFLRVQSIAGMCWVKTWDYTVVQPVEGVSHDGSRFWRSDSTDMRWLGCAWTYCPQILPLLDTYHQLLLSV